MSRFQVISGCKLIKLELIKIYSETSIKWTPSIKRTVAEVL